MLDSAKVTLDYNELQGILDTINAQKDEIAQFKESTEVALEPALNKIFDILDEASKEAEADKKQAKIYQCMCIFCDTFKIPHKELLEGVPDGSPVEVQKVTIKPVAKAPKKRRCQS